MDCSIGSVWITSMVFYSFRLLRTFCKNSLSTPSPSPNFLSSSSTYSSKLVILLFLTPSSFSSFYSKYLSSFTESSLLTLALFWICFALCPNFRVEMVSCSLKILGLQVTTKDVLLFPPRLSYRICVNLLSLYGIWLLLPSVSLKMTRPRTVSDLLILLASFRVSPYAPVLLILSEPAKSTKKILPVLEEKSVKFFYSICKMKQEWDLEDWEFMSVTPIALFSFPILSKENTSSSPPT